MMKRATAALLLLLARFRPPVAFVPSSRSLPSFRPQSYSESGIRSSQSVWWTTYTTPTTTPRPDRQHLALSEIELGFREHFVSSSASLATDLSSTYSQWRLAGSESAA
ncbi:hypothetical protein R3P38DRAFT_2864338 [Favolaschia claudopus]|uniref:Secreted protein n=1 Tax=Favolaschia claudopus TaxID=2862362 RepID=A0AAW0DCH4_9AGAR